MPNYEKLLKTYETPFYLYDFNQIKQAFLNYKEAFRGRKSLICYALKANSNLSILSLLASLESGADCVSIGEIKRALEAGIKPYRIVFSGVGKSEFEIEQALKLNILFLNVESFMELKTIEKIAQTLGIKARISIRINPNIDAKTHPYISTGLKENKFGVEEKEALEMFVFAKKSAFLEPISVHFHIGSQLLDLEPILEASAKVVKIAKSLIALGIDLRFFDVGGGIGVSYENEETIKLYDYAQGILDSLKGLDLTIICEPGRSIVAESGELVTQVLYEKVAQNKRFVVVDAGMNDFLRPSLYGAKHEIEVISSANKGGETSLCDVVGPVCESSDTFLKNIHLPPLEQGDILALKKVGAYGSSMASNYNSRPKLLELALENENVRVIRKKESLEDLWRLEKECLNG
ncbi:diaminopimelate decarboxylase [Helicobacter cetorum]|uniref:Diaminopimelate decarboxylase n=1 Tax=Helicobacter cetorum (strain ATCC BAA-429 / MIT 00-7128) TaxID=182217 RepID=I0EN74_HELC0|nr:diaminopimelate decarboxylase [Helicobacter cetorum]AFI04393.1 diaminopimelate decarboxylase [Helicobacter cetorum MIT 00-7128]